MVTEATMLNDAYEQKIITNVLNNELFINKALTNIGDSDMNESNEIMTR